MGPVDANFRSIKSYSADLPFKVHAKQGEAPAKVAQETVAWVRGQVADRVAKTVSSGPPPLMAAPPAPPPPITAATGTPGVVGSLRTALGNLERELKGLRPHQVEQFVTLLSQPKATLPSELAGAYQALDQATQAFQSASGRSDYEAVHSLLQQTEPPFRLSDELLGLGLAPKGKLTDAQQVAEFEDANRGRDVLTSSKNPALEDIRYIDVKSDKDGGSSLAIQHYAGNDAALGKAVSSELARAGVHVDVKLSPLGLRNPPEKPPLTEKQYIAALGQAEKARALIVDKRGKWPELLGVAYINIKEGPGISKPPTLEVQFHGGTERDEIQLKTAITQLLQRDGLLGDLQFKKL